MTINFNNQVVLTEVLGHRTHHNCIKVVNKTNGAIYASILDAAEELGVHPGTIHAYFNGKLKSVKGNKLEKIDHTSGNTDSLAKAIRNKDDEVAALKAQIAELEADAAIGRAVREEQEAKAKAIENAQIAYDKANAKVERRQRMVERKDAEYQVAVGRLMEAENERDKAWEVLMSLKGKEDEK